MLLNFGHTVGHAIEKLGNFTRFSHGAAVAMGMIAAAKIGETCGFSAPQTSERITSVLSHFNLCAELPYSPDELVSSMSMDKKNIGGKLNFILLSKIGNGCIVPMSLNDAASLFSKAYNNR